MKVWPSASVLVLFALVTCGPGWGADPDFSNVSDILGGQRHLLRNDDLVVTGAFGANHMPSVLTLRTADSKLSPPVRNDFALTSGQALSAIGRMYALPNDVVATLVVGSPGTFGVRIVDPVKGTTVFNPIHDAVQAVNAIIMADMNGDGYADLIVEYTVSSDGGFQHDVIRVATAADVTNPAAGLRWGPAQNEMTLDTFWPQPRLVTAGDFDGNGTLDLALVIGDTGGSNVARLNLYTIVPETLALSLATTTLLPEFSPGQLAFGDGDQASLAAGRFSAASHDQLVLVAAPILSSDFDGHWVVGEFKVLAIDFKGLQPIPAKMFSPGFGPGHRTGLARIRSGRIDWFGQRDQAAVLLDALGNEQVSILTFDTALEITQVHASVVRSGLPCLFDIDLGNFDRMRTRGSATERDPNLQVALLGSDCHSTLRMDLYDVDPKTFQLSPVPGIVTPLPGTPEAGFGMALAVGDTQGRSFQLGPPTKITVSGNIQPQVVLGMPPMHVDFICDAQHLGPTCAPSILNLTTKPSKYFSQYQTQQSAVNQSASTSTTSYSVANKETATEKFSYKIPETFEASAELKESAAQTHAGNVATRFNTYTGMAFDVSTQTGFSDLVWFTLKRLNVYAYQVLGQCAPAPDHPAGDGCPAGTAPVYVHFSGPDQVNQYRLDGTLLEWYQPVHQPGNVFSYPWSVDLLKERYPRFHALTADPAPVWSTDSSGSSVSVTWTHGSGSSVTSGTVSTVSFDGSASVAASVKIEGFSAGISGQLDYNSSTSVSTLNESTATLGTSTGIKIVKPSFEDPGQYAYAAQTYIFGQQAPQGTVQEIPLNTGVQSTGTVWTAFVADPTATGAGAGEWWRQAYTKPDVGLNHPSRWRWTPPTPTTGDVITFNAPNPDNAVDSEFYWMKGLYITPESADAQGPQITMTTAGERIRLQARVYNFSLADVPAGAEVRARFYGQRWNHTAHDFDGAAFVIDEVALAPIPGFNSDSTQGTRPNWTLATTTFDTTQYGNTYLKFWVVVWMEEAGQLVPEVPGHGLTALPGPATAPLDVAIESYSNNVGFYRQEFFVAPATSVAKPGRARPKLAPGTLEVNRVSVSPPRVAVHEKATITARLAAHGAPVEPVLVLFFAEDPAHGAQPFDAELASHVRSGDVYLARVKYQPTVCGTHTIFVVAHGGTASPATETATLIVDCKNAGRFTGKANHVASRKPDGKLRLSGEVPLTGPLDLSAATVAVTSLLRETSGADLVEGDGGLFPSLILTARQRGKPSDATFQTPPGTWPSVQLDVHRTADTLAFELAVDGARIRTPQSCERQGRASARLSTVLTVAVPDQASLDIGPELFWRCSPHQLMTP